MTLAPRGSTLTGTPHIRQLVSGLRVMIRIRPLAQILFVALAPFAGTQHSLAEFNWAKPLRVDLGMNTGRNDTGTPGWREWQVVDGAEASQQFDGVKVTLRAATADELKISDNATATLKGTWNKAGLALG